MDQLLQQIVAGLETGSSYALIGLAVVVIMKSTDVPNFAMAEMGLVAAFMAWFLSGDPDKGGVGWPFWLAIVLALAFAAVFGAITQFFLVRPLTGLSNQPLAIFAALGLGYASVGFINDEGLPSFLDWFPVTKGGFPLAVAIILAIFTVVLTYLMIRHWVKPLAIVDHFPLLLLTIGLNFALGSVIENIWGSTPKRFKRSLVWRDFRSGQYPYWLGSSSNHNCRYCYRYRNGSVLLVEMGCEDASYCRRRANRSLAGHQRRDGVANCLGNRNFGSWSSHDPQHQLYGAGVG